MDSGRHEQQKRDTRRVFWFLGLLTVSLLIVLAFGILTDEPPVDDAAFLAGLHLPQVAVSNPLSEFQDWLDAHNPLPELVKLLHSEGTTGVKDLRQAKGLPKRRLTDSITREVFRLTDPHMSKLESLLTTDHHQWQFRGVHAGMNLVTSRLEPWILCDLTQVVEARAEALKFEKHAGRALAEDLLLHRLGKRLAAIPGSMSHLMAGLRLQLDGIEKIREQIVATSGLSASDLRAISSQLSEDVASFRDHLRTSIRCEYLLIRNSLRDMPVAQLQTGGMDPPLDRLLKRNATTRLVFESSQAYFEAVRLDWATYQRRTNPIMLAARDCSFGPLHTKALISGIAGGNLAGRRAWGAMVATNPTIMEHAFKTATVRDIALLQLAVRQFELANGWLPARLEELLPALIAEIPDDFFGGAKIRWVPSKQVFYSCGTDGLDDGGTIDPARMLSSKARDMGEHYWWKSSP